MSIADAYDTHDALGLAQLVQKKEVTPSELLDEAIRRVCALNPQLNAVVLEMFEEGHRVIAAGLPEGPLRGVPFLLKDLAQPYAGFPLTQSSKLYEKFVPRQHGELTRRYLRAGVVIFGRTSSSEFGILPTTEPLLHGPCHNPWKQGFTTGGSSGGAAAAVAARIVPVAHGADAGGSIRIPASCCGVFGLKPSRGRNPGGPDTERGHGLATEHVLSLTVRDSAAFLDATAGPGHTALYRAPPKTGSYLEATRTPPGRLKIAFTHRPLLPGAEDPDCRRAVEDAVRLLSELGHECVEAAPPVEGTPVSQAFFAVYCAEVAGELQFARHYLGRPARPSDVEPITWLMGMIGRSVLSAGDFSEGMRRLQEMSSDVHRFMESYDCYLTPTLGQPPVAHGSLGAQGPEKAAHELVARLDFTLALKFPGMVGKAVARAFGFAPFTPVSNVTGQPSMSVPLWWNAQGLPVGVCFTSRLGDEATLFRLAAQLEQARPWRARKPPLCAAQRA